MHLAQWVLVLHFFMHGHPSNVVDGQRIQDEHMVFSSRVECQGAAMMVSGYITLRPGETMRGDLRKAIIAAATARGGHCWCDFQHGRVLGVISSTSKPMRLVAKGTRPSADID
ncbi:MAG TPA: hypothetical protein VGJ20_07190 [Xanthobacteraceae bacterium]|jgi:hypothetical protein